jgi:hypothetical protein
VEQQQVLVEEGEEYHVMNAATELAAEGDDEGGDVQCAFEEEVCPQNSEEPDETWDLEEEEEWHDGVHYWEEGGYHSVNGQQQSFEWGGDDGWELQDCYSENLEWHDA